MDIIHNYFETIAPADREAPHVGRPRRREPRPAEKASPGTAGAPGAAAPLGAAQPAAPEAPAPAPEATP
jgi:hypothetical protein